MTTVTKPEIMMHLAKAAEHLTEVNSSASVADISNYEEVTEVSQLAFLLTLVAKQFAEGGDQGQARATLKSVRSQLNQLVKEDCNAG
jgi:hypothetical protein